MNTINALVGDIKLRFNIDNPSLEECYCFGYESQAGDLAEDDNPFSEGSVEYNYWQDGWWASFYEEEPLFQLESLSDNQAKTQPANDVVFSKAKHGIFSRWLKTTGAIAASAFIGYQLIDLVA